MGASGDPGIGIGVAILLTAGATLAVLAVMFLAKAFS